MVGSPHIHMLLRKGGGLGDGMQQGPGWKNTHLI